MSKVPVSMLRTLVAVASVCHGAGVEPRPESSAPPVECELQMTVWCIREGAQEIVSQFSQQGAYRRAWIIRGFYQPQWPLVVLEPRGCREGAVRYGFSVGL